LPDLSAPITIFTAEEYDAAAVRRRWQIIIGAALLLLVLLGLGWHLRYLRYEIRVKTFFTAIQNKEYEHAFAIWNNDPEWQQHTQQYKGYPFGQFYLDWGPAGEYGPIRSFHVDSAESPGHKSSSGVIVTVTINERSEKARIWVEKKDKKLSYAPDILF
jgi:hypothetical protein